MKTDCTTCYHNFSGTPESLACCNCCDEEVNFYQSIQEEEEEPMRNATVSLNCPFCGADHEVEVNFDEYLAWQGGECIQYAMPNHSATEREQLISGMCPKCQAKIFGE